MTPIKSIVLFGNQVFVKDMADLIELKAICPAERDAAWIASSLASAHNVHIEVPDTPTMVAWTSR